MRNSPAQIHRQPGRVIANANRIPEDAISTREIRIHHGEHGEHGGNRVGCDLAHVKRFDVLFSVFSVNSVVKISVVNSPRTLTGELNLLSSAAIVR
jgi:hypothetical protein